MVSVAEQNKQHGNKHATSGETGNKSAEPPNQEFSVMQRNLYLRGLSRSEREDLVTKALGEVVRLMADPKAPPRTEPPTVVALELLDLVKKCAKQEKNPVEKEVRRVKVAQGLARMMRALSEVNPELPPVVLAIPNHVPNREQTRLHSGDPGLLAVAPPKYHPLLGAVIAQRLACTDGDSAFVKAVRENTWPTEKLESYIHALRVYSLRFDLHDPDKTMLVENMSSAEGIAKWEKGYASSKGYPSLWEPWASGR